MLLKGISVTLLLRPWIVIFVDGLLKAKAASQCTNKDVTQAYLTTSLTLINRPIYIVSFVGSLLNTEMALEITYAHVTQT